MSGSKPLRILHVVGAMNRAGIETWLMHVLRNMDRERFHLDFLSHTLKPGAYDEEIRSLGSDIHPCLSPSRPWSYARNFRRVLRDHGPYDIVHSHVHHFTGYVMWLSRKAGVKVRIAHSHSDTSRKDANSSFVRRSYLSLMRRWVARCASVKLAASHQAGQALFGPLDTRINPWDVFYCGVDLEPFQVKANREEVRRELGIPVTAPVIGHVGRITEPKNHRFLIKIMAEVAQREPEARLLLVGEGELRPAIEQQIRESGLEGRVLFTGSRPDVARLMLGAMDVFVMPSLHEGLPLVGIEAQAAGLPCLFSDVITPEVDVVSGLVRRLSLDRSASIWAEAVLDLLRSPATSDRSESLQVVRESPFNIRTAVHALESLYLAETSSGLSRGRPSLVLR